MSYLHFPEYAVNRGSPPTSTGVVKDAMFKTIKAKLALLSTLGFLAVALSVTISYFIAIREIKTIMKADVAAVADALEKTITYIATVKPDARNDMAFKQAIYAVKIGKSGYPFLLDESGTLVVHHKEEGKNLAGQPHIDHIRSHPDSGFYEYTAKTTGQDKIVAYRYIRPWGLWVVPGVNKADYFDQLKASFLKWNVGCAVIIILLLSVASIWIVRGIAGPVQAAVAVADRLATGDLTMNFTQGRQAAGGEVGALIEAQRTMVTGLNSMVVRINASCLSLSGISDSVSGSAGQVTEVAARQAAAVAQASQAVDAILASVQQVAQGVEVLSVSATETSSSTLEMRASVEEVGLNMENLSAAVDEVSSSVTEMSAAVKQIGTSVQGLMEVSSTTGSSIAEMDYSIRQVGENAGLTASISREVLEEAEAGRESVQATITGIEDMRRASQATAQVIDALSTSVAGIGAILGVIDGVTSQTNLLALNAAIIAAQAGEHGKGFSVVAGEIKQLADQTKLSTGEIGKVINDVLDKTATAVKTIGEAQRSIDSGALLSRKSGEVLEKIVDRVKNSADQAGEIARATIEQAKGGQMIKKAMEDMSEMVLQIRNATREQEKGGELIISTVERMKGLNSQVRNSAREHNSASTDIALATERITAMVEKIKEACNEQSRCGARIAGEMETITRSADGNLHASAGMNQAVAGLGTQVEVLQQEMAGFRTV
jgi:methyl-accepting chemotaxis protein